MPSSPDLDRIFNAYFLLRTLCSAFATRNMSERTALQFIKSVRAYLEWRAGTSWRGLDQRFHPERLYYLRGLATLDEAWNAPGAQSLKTYEELGRLLEQAKQDYARSQTAITGSSSLSVVRHRAKQVARERESHNRSHDWRKRA